MRVKFLVGGVMLLILGGAFVIGAYIIFNQYSVWDSHHFGGPSQTWRFPNPPLELSEGDILRVGIMVGGSGTTRIYVMNAAGAQVQLLQEPGGVYHVQTNDLYHVNVTQESIGTPAGVDVGLNVTVTQKAPDSFFLFLGIFAILVGAILVSVSIFYKSKPSQGI